MKRLMFGLLMMAALCAMAADQKIQEVAAPRIMLICGPLAGIGKIILVDADGEHYELVIVCGAQA